MPAPCLTRRARLLAAADADLLPPPPPLAYALVHAPRSYFGAVVEVPGQKLQGTLVPDLANMT